ncbi:2-hydroxyacyl-CoA dehydratase subunit D [Nocardioides mangrovi]|uniref:2-hydroxyacyl-CoA dehydratase family protein n=1 Tax=Nocardioides mangrovi TaxID=2874580 RepID=A0ABS7UBR0_9ACTN|nr:2-hydroxyacyl-CoA dehydratase family protein [Nocardioides mangrovi]MBZ5738439.1 2-hydroxyacyl-CoA dehydratase family protein [Nocardioides mangrovi]
MASSALEELRGAARDHRSYIARWRAEHPGALVLGVMPMNYPRELAHAAGVLPVIVPDDLEPVTEGRGLIPEFYCGYTRNLADQAATGRLGQYDAILLADHCIQLLGATDVGRVLEPQREVFLGMLATSLSDSWADAKVRETLQQHRREIERITGTTIQEEALRSSIRAFNADRALLRGLLDARAAGSTSYSPVELVDLVASAQVMDPLDHLPLLREVIGERSEQASERDDRVRVHISGHLCHAPRRELLEAIEESGATVVDDDIYTGRRYAQTDVDESLPPLEALGHWYAQRNVNLPCPTRVQQEVDWDGWLLEAIERSGAEVVVHLMPKFCEPHMLYYPELRKALDAAGIPQLLIETEHEGIPLESFRTRIEALVERALRMRPAYA